MAENDPDTEPDLTRNAAGGPQLKETRARRFGKADKAVFLDTLAATCNIAASARACGFSTSTIERHRNKDATFRDNVRRALTTGYKRLEMAMLERAIHGVEEEVWHAGKVVGTKIVYSDNVALRLLALHRDSVETPERETEIDREYEEARADLEARLDEMRERLHDDEA